MLAPSKPTTSVAAVVELFMATPEPAKEPQAVVSPLRLRKAPVARVSAELREPARVAPVRIEPALTTVGPA